jgi:hypothetical protein
MTTLLVLTTGQTDVQLVIDNKRHKLDGETCGILHDEIKTRTWHLTSHPFERSREIVKKLPDGDLLLCTPKLDAILAFPGYSTPITALICETNRQTKGDPRFAGVVIEHRLRERGVTHIIRVPYLSENQQLEDRENPFDAVVRRDVVIRLSRAIADSVKDLQRDDRVFLAATGGLSAANEVISELVRLHCIGGPNVTALEVPDNNRDLLDDRAVEEKFHPASGIRARWHALSLIMKGNLLAAWGAVNHLESMPDQEWTKVVKWLYYFASSLPLPSCCDLTVLNHPRMAVRAALRVELALRAGDIPRAVHGTVAFFEAALWDHLLNHFESDPSDARWLKLRDGAPEPKGKLLRETKVSATLDEKLRKENLNCPFERKVRKIPDDQTWYWFHEEGAGRFAIDYPPRKPSLKKLVHPISDIRPLRNDVAHNEPTTSLMNEARDRMQKAGLWSNNNTFLSQQLVRDVLKELSVPEPEKLLEILLNDVRRRLVTPDVSPAP